MPLPDFDVCYRALLARDERFDGVFFTGVKTTGIYCRPVCRARTPQAKSCRFYPTAAGAEGAGFRPCLVCRPELAPGDSSLERALYTHVQTRALCGEPLETVAASAGYSSRQLRRVLLQHYGVTPVEIAQTQRLLFAKKLLQETALPVIDIAESAGFGSLRRFNALFLSRYRLSPTALRRNGGEGFTADGLLSLRLAFRPPFAWEQILAYLARRATGGVEAVTDGSYTRSVATADGAPDWVRVSRATSGDFLRVEAPAHLASALHGILPRLRNLFDLDANPTVIDFHLANDERLAPMVRACPGLRMPGAWDVFDLALRAVLGQQVSVAGATTLAGRLARRFGRPVKTPLPGVTHLAPTASDLAEADLSNLGVPGSRARTIRSIAQASVRGELDFPRWTEPAEVVVALTRIPGIGEWTAQYIAMRALRFPDAFPDADLGLRKALTDGQRTPYISAREVRRLSEPWRPWRAYAAMHLWHSL